jgi:hypothetical protein
LGVFPPHFNEIEEFSDITMTKNKMGDINLEGNSFPKYITLIGKVY